MTVTAQTARNVSIAAPGATVFPYGFKIIVAGDILVTVNGVTVTNYTLSGVGDDGGGNVTFTTPMAGGETVLRKRNMAYARSTDFQNLGDLHSSTLNNDQDSPVLMVQQIAAAQSLNVSLPEDSSGISNLLPAPLPLAPLVWNAAGDALDNGTFGDADLLLRGDLANTSSTALGAALVGYLAEGAGAAPLRSVRRKLRERISAADFGAIGDGTSHPVSQWLVGGTQTRGYVNLAAITAIFPHVTSLTDEIDYAAIQQAINYCATVKQPLYLNGDYRTNKQIEIINPVTILGEGWSDEGATSGPLPRNIAIVANANMNAIIHMKSDIPSPDPGDDLGGLLAGCRLEGFALDGLGGDAAGTTSFVDYCIQAESVQWSVFRGLYLNRAKVAHFDASCANTNNFFGNFLDMIYNNDRANTACANAHGIRFRQAETASGGCVQNTIGRAYNIVKNGFGLYLGGCDNNTIERCFTYVQPAGTGGNIKFAQGNGQAGVTWAPTTVYALNEWVKPITPTGYMYQVTTAGTSGAVEPVWPVITGNTVANGSVVFTTRTVTQVHYGVAARNNLVIQGNGHIVAESPSKGNRLLYTTSEGTSVTVNSGAQLHYMINDNGNGELYSTPVNKISDQMMVQAGDMQIVSGATVGSIAGLYAALNFADGVQSSVSFSPMAPFDWVDGVLTGLTIFMAPLAGNTSAGNILWRLRGGQFNGTLMTTAPMDQTGPVMAIGGVAETLRVDQLVFNTPLAITRTSTGPDVLAGAFTFNLERVGTNGLDTNTGTIQLLGVALHFKANGPDSTGGTYNASPRWTF